MAKKKRIDWEQVEKDYRAGLISLRKIAEHHGTSESTIRSRAKKYAWERDLTTLTQARARERLSRTASRMREAPTDEEVIEDGAKQIEALVRIHRADILKGRKAVASMLNEVLDGSQDAPTLAELGEQYIDDNGLKGNAAASIRKAISLPTRAATVRDLSTALGRLVALERQAYSVDSQPDSADGSLADALTKARQRAQILERERDEQ